ASPCNSSGATKREKIKVKYPPISASLQVGGYLFGALDRIRTSDTFEGLTPHTLRCTFATIVEEEAGLRTASMALGHSSLEITEKAYVRRGHLAKGTSTVIESAIVDEKLQTMGGNLWVIDELDKNNTLLF